MSEKESAQHIELSEASDQSTAERALTERELSLINNMEVDVEARIGNTTMTVEKLFALKIGELVELQVSVEEPVMLLAERKVIAAGRLVAIDGNFGVEITELKG